MLAVHGELDLATAEALARPAQEAITGRRPLIVDLTACSFLELERTAGLTTAGSRGSSGRHGLAVPMAVVIGGSPAGRLLSLTELDKRLSVFTARQEADGWLASEWKPNGKPGPSSKRSTA